MWYPKIVVANGGALHGPDIGSREGTVSGEKLRQRQISLPIFFVKKESSSAPSSQEDAIIRYRTEPPTSIVVPNSRGEEPTCAYRCLLSRISYSIQTKGGTTILSEKPPTPLPQKPHTTTASLIFWGIFSSGAAICFWSRFAKSLETGNKDLYTSEGLVAVCASGLLLAVLLEAARIWRMRRRK